MSWRYARYGWACGMACEPEPRGPRANAHPAPPAGPAAPPERCLAPLDADEADDVEQEDDDESTAGLRSWPTLFGCSNVSGWSDFTGEWGSWKCRDELAA